MAEICVIHVSEDDSLVERLVDLLRRKWEVWWDRDISHGDWESRVRKEIAKSKVVISVLSQSTSGERAAIIADEMRFAKKKSKPLLPFLIGSAEVPFGFGGLNHTNAGNWTGEENSSGFIELKSKVAAAVGTATRTGDVLERQKTIALRDKNLVLPNFVFSVSSHETQISPLEGAVLLNFLEPEAILLSAYDLWKYYRRSKELRSVAATIRQSRTVLFLDSGNYEAFRKNDHYTPKGNPKGWRQQDFWDAATKLSADVVFGFDTIDPRGKPNEIIARVIKSFHADEHALSKRDFLLCPIVHLPMTSEGYASSLAPIIVAGVASELSPPLIAIPERELGDGLLERVAQVKAIRDSLDGLGKYYPLHLLGTGNPLSIAALAAAGADSFDGLEWCRTVADYESGYLFHFQHFDCFRDTRFNRIQDVRIRSIVSDPKASYHQRTLSYNVDYFKDLTRTMQNLIHANQWKVLLKMVPNIGGDLIRAISP